MNTRRILPLPIGCLLALLAVTLLSVIPVQGQPAYFRAVTNLNAVGYWPMHEVEAAVPGNIETNYGTLGSLANGYYNDWTTLPGANAKILRQVPGPLVSSPDTGTFFTNNAARVTTAGYLLIPNVAGALALKPPFTIEGWAQASAPQVGAFSTIMGQGGGAGFNNSANYTGWSLNWNNPSGNSGAIYNMYAYGGSGSSTIANCASASSTTITSNTWYYFAYVFTANNTTYCVVNGNANGPSAQLNPPLPTTTWSPVFLGNGRNGTTGPGGFSFDGALAEVAIYTNEFTTADLNAHYNAGISANPPTSYSQLVLNSNPIVYLRMNAPAYTAPSSSTWPALTNYGAAAANGVYTPGTVPGLLTGAPAASYPVALSNQVPMLSAMGTFADAGNSSLYNPSGASATFSISALFRGNPADPRTQTIVGHGTNSWTLGLTTAGKVVFNPGTNSATATGTGTATGDLVGTAVSNDGLWHHVVAVHNLTNNLLYVDGTLVATNVTTNSIPGNTLHVMIGADPSFTNANDNLGRQFSGQVCEVALFTNALASADVQTLYGNLGVVPFINQQPVSTSANGGSALTNTVGVSGSPTLSYRWYFNTVSNYTGARAVTNTTDGRILGATTGALLFTNLHGSDAGFYFAVVTNNYGAVTSSLASLQVTTGPVITSQLPVPHTNQFTLFAGVSPTFSVVAEGSAPLRYQWYRNGVSLPQGTNASLTLSNLSPGSLSAYCVITNTVGTVTSFIWNAAVVPAPSQPYPQSVLALGPLGYWRLNEADDTSWDGNPGAIAHDYAGGNNGIFTNALLGQTGYSDGLASQDGYSPATEPGLTASRFGYIAFNDGDANSIAGIDFSAPSGNNVSFTVEAWVNGLGQFTGSAGIVSKGYFNNEEFVLDAGAANKCYRFSVRAANGTLYTASSKVPTSDNLWHHVVGVCDQPHGVVNLYVDGLLAGSTTIPAASGLMAANAANPMLIGARPADATTGANYQFYGFINDVAVFAYALSASQVQGQYNAAGVPAYFVQQLPASITVNEFSTLTIAAPVGGTAPMTYQWWDATAGTPLPNQTSATLLINNVSAGLNGHQLYLQAANSYGASANSSLVTLTIVTGPPTITLNLPTPVFTPAGKPYTYSIAVSGPQPYSYQWYFNGAPVVGQTQSRYTFNAASGLYKVVVTNPDGSTTSTVSTLTAVAPPAFAYSSTVLSAYGAVGYWPLQETTPAAPANVETNLGTLGALGNAYYAGTNATNVTFGQTGALPNDADTAVAFSGVNGTTPTSFAFIPRLSPALTLKAPFTWEVWVKPTSSQFGDLFAYGAGSGLNGGNWAGFRLSWGGNFQIYADDGTSSTGFTSSYATGSYPSGQWHYCVVTYDGTTANVYVDGNSTPAASGAVTMATDTWTPLTIGAGRWQGVPTRGFNGLEDEVAIYTNVLSVSDMMAHYNDGLNGAAGTYVADVLSKHPLLYYRMDNPGFTSASPLLYPSALNYGTAPVNGAYQPGTVPGGVSGPVLWGLGTNLVAAPINGVLSCVDAGNDASFNRTGTQPFSAGIWFKGYPSDSRLQSLMSHGTNWAMNLDGASGRLVWNVNSAGSVTSADVFNDGAWHFAVGVYDGSRNSLYVDGALNATASATGALAGDTNANLFLGGNADYTTAGNQSFFGGELAQAAYFTNALSAVQVGLLCDLATATPSVSLSRSGTQLVVTYSGTLMSSTNVAGPYTPVNGATPPTYTISATNSQRFYRARQ